jgi:hypothetical protein
MHSAFFKLVVWKHVDRAPNDIGPINCADTTIVDQNITSIEMSGKQLATP